MRDQDEKIGVDEEGTERNLEEVRSLRTYVATWSQFFLQLELISSFQDSRLTR